MASQQHEELEKKGVEAYVNKTMFGKKAKKTLKKWTSEEKKEQEEEKKHGV